LAAILGTVKAVFAEVSVTNVVATAWLNAAICAAIVNRFIGANTVPLDVAAVCVKCAYALLNCRFLAPDRAVGLAAITLTVAAIIGACCAVLIIGVALSVATRGGANPAIVGAVGTGLP